MNFLRRFSILRLAIQHNIMIVRSYFRQLWVNYWQNLSYRGIMGMVSPVIQGSCFLGIQFLKCVIEGGRMHNKVSC